MPGALSSFPDASALADALAQRCEQPRFQQDQWHACCPAHEDHTPSLTISAGHDKVLLHCFAGCTPDAIVTALGLTMADLFVRQRDGNGHKRIVKVYDYHDASGLVVHQTVRYEPKGFSQRRPDPAHPGEYLWQDVYKDIEPVLYNLPAVLQGLRDGALIHLAEGEKDADTLSTLGFIATTVAMGAKHWRESYTALLTGADVVVWPDNDEPGQAGAAKVKRMLDGKAKQLRFATVPHPHKDVSDWIKAGGTHADVLTQLQACTPPAPLAASLVSAPELLTLQLAPKAPYLDWLKERSLVMVYGPTGVGKTLWMLELGLSLSMPRSFLKWPAHQQLRVLFVDGEMALDSLQERVCQLAGDYPPPGFHLLPSELVYDRSGRDLTLTGSPDRLAIDAMLEEHKIKVLILDNVSCLFPGLDESKKQDWEPINAWLIRLRHRGITVIVGHHAGKNGQQRGTSGRGDHLDTIINLSLPPGHQAQDGCHLHLRFEKSRGIFGPPVEPLDVRLEHSAYGHVWTYAALEKTRTEQVKTMLTEGIPPKVIADELTVHLSYVYRMKTSLGL
jgi:putative DNA primase/helicase